MSKAQKIFKGAYYYALIISALILFFYLAGAILSYFNGFTFLFSTDYGLDAVASWLFLVGMILGVIIAPFLIFALICAIYYRYHPKCKELRLADYVKNKWFYAPVVIVAGGGLILSIITFGLNFLQSYFDTYNTEVVREAMEKGIFYEMPYTEDLDVYTSRVMKMSHQNMTDFVNKHFVDEENGYPKEFVDYMLEPYHEFADFIVIVLPVHNGKLQEVTLIKSSENQGLKKARMQFEASVNQTKEQYVSCYIISERYYPGIYLVEDHDRNWKMDMKLKIKD